MATWKQTEMIRKVAQAGSAAGVYLPEREREVIKLRVNRNTRGDVGEYLGLYPERVRQIEGQAVNRILAAVTDTPVGFYFFERFGP